MRSLDSDLPKNKKRQREKGNSRIISIFESVKGNMFGAFEDLFSFERGVGTSVTLGGKELL